LNQVASRISARISATEPSPCQKDRRVSYQAWLSTERRDAESHPRKASPVETIEQLLSTEDAAAIADERGEQLELTAGDYVARRQLDLMTFEPERVLAIKRDPLNRLPRPRG
jgi:hypothetical protein